MGVLLKLLVLALVVVWLLYSPAIRGRLRAAKPGKPTNAAKKGTASPRPPRAPDRIVPCANCGVHLPLSEALMHGDGHTYCSEAHRQKGPGA
jgi:uncharacterized protein